MAVLRGDAPAMRCGFGPTNMELGRRELLLGAGLTIITCGYAHGGIPLLPRRLRLRNANTGETFEGPYRDAAGPIPAAIADLAILLRDHHANKVGPVHVETLDYLSDVMSAVGLTQATILSAFRTPETNARLRATQFGVAEKSQHLLGRALDVTFDAHLSDARAVALKMGRGGVGWYPRSHFVHLDTGPRRSWEMGGTGLQLLLTDGSQATMRLGYKAKAPKATAPALAPTLPHCRQTTNGVLVTRGIGCAP